MAVTQQSRSAETSTAMISYMAPAKLHSFDQHVNKCRLSDVIVVTGTNTAPALAPTLVSSLQP